jgi:hypothetical protein
MIFDKSYGFIFSINLMVLLLSTCYYDSVFKASDILQYNPLVWITFIEIQ